MKKEKNFKNENDKLVAETIKLFEPINMGVAKLYGNKTERRDVLILHKQLGDKLPLVIAYIPTYNASLKPRKDGKVFGKVLKPSELLFRLQDVFDAKRKLDREIHYQLAKEEIEKKEKEDERKRKELEDSYTKDERERLRKIRNDNMRKAMGFN